MLITLCIFGWLIGAMITAKIFFMALRHGERNKYTEDMDGFTAASLSLAMWPLILTGLIAVGLCFGMCKLLRME